MHGINFMERVIEDIEDVMFSISTIGEIMDPTLLLHSTVYIFFIKREEKQSNSQDKGLLLVGKTKYVTDVSQAGIWRGIRGARSRE